MATAKTPELDWYIPIALKMVQAKYSWALGLHSRAETPSSGQLGAQPAKARPAKTSAKASAAAKVRRAKAQVAQAPTKAKRLARP